jgi:tetratricopeptide (TPR) repeat protein
LGLCSVVPEDWRDRLRHRPNSSVGAGPKKGLAQLDTKATKNPAGELDIKLGEIYYDFGDYQSAVTAINRGLQKGQVQHRDEAYVYLGRSEVALKSMESARTGFADLKLVRNMSPTVLKLWNLHAETVAQ